MAVSDPRPVARSRTPTHKGITRLFCDRDHTVRIRKIACNCLSTFHVQRVWVLQEIRFRPAQNYLPLSMRKTNPARLLVQRPDGDFEQGKIGPELFRKACEFGLEGLVSMHRDRPYRVGRQKFWIKVKNRKLQ